MKFIDLFAGIWWIRLWFENTWFQCVFSNDYDKFCKITYDINFSKLFDQDMVLWDIKTIPNSKIPDCDILCWWFPCQPFSIAWYRQGFDDEKGRGNVFFEIVRILKDKKPNVFLLENVKNLKTHDNWNTIKIIYQELEKLWYFVKDKVMNSLDYANIPQNRERIYIVGFLNKNSFDKFKFPRKIPLTKTIHDFLEDKVDEKYYYNWKPLYEKIKNDIINKKYNLSAKEKICQRK